METQKNSKLTKRDIRNVYFRWWMGCELTLNFERYQGLGFCNSFAPCLEKLYGPGEELQKALKRHLEFFNTQAIWGAMIPGAVLAMEEAKASGEDIPDETITSFKTGLMGPMAGIGDALEGGTFMAIVNALGASFAIQGNILGPILIIAYNIFDGFVGNFLFNMGYKMGRQSVSKVLKSGMINKLIQCGSIIGMFMMGALSSSFVKLTTKVKFNINGQMVVIQDTIDQIAPGLLSLGLVFLVFWAIKYKKMSITKLLLILIVFCLVGALIGLF
ncbi:MULTISPECIES: PTS system mannose/fructose/sorbose family transporter subunit IID [Enterococcaceae]|uniref:PTS fructose transporter subunit IID n=1 Tax=Vagococcus vulneris TaxID=1977869 RepID=A0A430A2G7_9ENTE|nr:MULTISPECIES: PTS system mannose/fructose/sorbose family transporter subunit IID [Enterococcaceae]EJE4563043.1 PTS system mannose/fructose/sorbose family transporter subunit IID [Enterococcus faecium]EJX51163.1 putative mannose permease IID component [Enterococcus faecium R497]EKY7882988.1 PTS system mannose/fructose/sorbose family transporter subunit IID [Enterococcus faecium]EKZ0059233.1 PTS system mannose/fructose/sorbose family transporter subunit IID [Enterococcus faecium]MBG7725258.1 